MRRFDKNKNMQKANLLAEQRYLESKDSINEIDGGEVDFKLPSQLMDTLSQHFDNVSVSKSKLTFKPSADTGAKPQISYSLTLQLGEEEFEMFLTSGGANNANDVIYRFPQYDKKIKSSARKIVFALLKPIIGLMRNTLESGKETVGKFTSGGGYEDKVTDEDLKMAYDGVAKLMNAEMKEG